MKNDADVRAFAFFLRARGELLALLYKWFFTPGELLRYAVRYLMVGGTETKGELLSRLSACGQAFFARQEFADEVEEKLCLRLLRDAFLRQTHRCTNVERRAKGCIAQGNCSLRKGKYSPQTPPRPPRRALCGKA